MLLALALLAAGPVPASGSRLVTSTLPLRAAPSVEAPVLARVPLGTVLPCVERRGGSCKATWGNEVGWYQESSTAPVEEDLEAQVRRLIEEKLVELSPATEGPRLTELHELHRLLVRRIDGATGPADAWSRRLVELRLVLAAAHAFPADPRVYRDEAQGPRLKREAIWRLADDAMAADREVAEQAAWLAVQHGHDFECEGYAPCTTGWLELVECAYLTRFPGGPHAGDVLRRVSGTLLGVVEQPDPFGGLPREDLDAVRDAVRVARACVASTSRGEEASAAIDAADRVLAMLP